MDKSLLIKDITALARFEPAIKLQAISVDWKDHYFHDYILTEDLADVYEKILSSILSDGWGSTASTLPAERRRAHLLSAQYGTGKSYFLTILSALLDTGGNAVRLQTAKEKFGNFREVQNLLGQLSDKRFLIIQVSAEDKGDIRFKELLVRSLLDQVSKVLPDAVFSNEYTEAANHLAELESLPIGSVFARALDEQFGLSLQQLRAKLDSYDRDGLHTYYQSCERALGRKVSRDVLDLETTFREALDLLKPKGYTHIAVLIDELTTYLNASVGHHSLAETLGELQGFAAYCNRPTSHCLFVGVMHVSVEIFLKERSQQRDFDKMRGRFDEHAFPFYSTKLLAGVFKPKDNFDQAVKSYRDQVEELTDLIKTFNMIDDGRPMKLSDFFPLHPAIAHYLPRISRVLGQAERTSFGFIDEVVRKKLDEPLACEGRLNLVTLDQVFDYFLPAMEQREAYLQVITAYNTVQSKLSDSVAHRAFKPLALLWIASRVHPEEVQYLQTDLSGEQVADFIGVEDSLTVTEALNSLCATGHVYFDRSTGRYFYVYGDVGWDLESEIQEKMDDVDADEVLQSELLALESRVDLNVPATVTVKVERGVESQWMDIEHLEEVTSVKPKRITDGKIIFVVPRFGEAESYEAKFSDVALKARGLSAPNVIVAVPKKVDMLNPMELRRYCALQEIGRQLDGGKPGTAGELRVRLTRARVSEVQARVQRDVEEFGQASNFIFFVNHQPQEAQDLNMVLVDMFERYYYKFPKVRAERIAGRNTTNALIDNCIANPRKTFSGDTSEVARHARDTLQVLGLCSWDKAAGGQYVVELKEPKLGSEGYEIWKIVLDTLTDASTPFAALYERLSGQPYGLPDYMVELYIAAAIALQKVLILDESGKMATPNKAFVADITKRKDKHYQVVSTQKIEVSPIYVCSVWQAIDEPLGLWHYQELQKSLGRTIDDQKTWLTLKADARNLLQNRLSQVQENLKVIEAESTAFTTLVSHLEQLRPILPAAQGFEQLALLGKELSGVQVNTNPDAAASVVRQTIEAADQFLTDWEILQSAHRQYRRLQQTVDLERFGVLGRDVDEAWQAYRSDVLSAERRQAFIEQFEKLWQHYTEQYVNEHNVVAKTRANYGKQVEQSLAYALVSEFSQFGFGGIATRSSFDARIGKVRQRACQPLTENSVRDYRQFGKAICSCGYRPGAHAEILAQLQESEASLVISVNNALDSYLVKLDQSLGAESIQVYVREQASAEERTTLASVQDLTSKGREMNEAQYKKLRALLPDLRLALSKASDYVKQQARKREELQRQLEEEERQKRIPRLPTTQLGEAVRSFLLDSGLDAMTLKELEERLRLWLQEIAREFKPQK